MCLGNFVKGIDNLSILDTNYMTDDNDNCDYLDLDEKLQIGDLDLSLLHLNV